MHQDIEMDDTDKYMGAAPKVIFPIFSYWVTVSEPDVGGMAVKFESSQQYSVQCCCYATGAIIIVIIIIILRGVLVGFFVSVCIVNISP